MKLLIDSKTVQGVLFAIPNGYVGNGNLKIYGNGLELCFLIVSCLGILTLLYPGHVLTSNSNAVSSWKHKNGYIKFYDVRFQDVSSTEALIVLESGDSEGSIEIVKFDHFLYLESRKTKR